MPVDLSAPQYMREAATQGLAFLAEGYGGEGLTDKTIREAQAMSAGDVSADKWLRIGPWIERHLVDLDAPAADSESEDYPSNGVVAHLLWGSGPSKDDARRTLAFAQGKAAEIDAEANSRMTENLLQVKDNKIMNIRAAAGELSVGDYARWDSSGGLARGEITRIVTTGTLNVPGTDFRLNATAEDPAALIQLYVESGDGYDKTDTLVGHRFSTLTKIDEPQPPSDSPTRVKGEGRELRFFETRVSSADFEVRETSEGMTFEGYAAVFGSRSENLGGFTEFVAPGAFTRSIKTRNDVKLLWNHDTGQVLGSTRAGSMSLTEDEKGLRVIANLPNTQLGRDTAELLRTGLVDSMSFGFNVIKDSWNTAGDERTLQSVRLHEVSIVSFPAYTATSGTATVRSLSVLATRAEVDAQALELALTKLEAGEDLDTDSRNLLTSVIDKLSPSASFDPEPAPSIIGDLGLLELKKKKMSFLESI